MTERDEMAALADKLEFAANNTEGCLYSQRKMLNAAAQALRSAARTDSDAGYGVKPLEWSRESATAHVPETWRAKSIGREYDIQRTGDGKFDLWADAGTALTVEDTLDEAKAAAQADFEQRIRSAITATVGTAEPGYVAGFEACREAALSLNIKLRGFAGQSDAYLSGFEAGCEAMNDAIAALPIPAGEEVTAEAIKAILVQHIDCISDDERCHVEIDGVDEAAHALRSTYKITKRSAT